MFYLPPKEFWYLTAARLSVTFDDQKEGSGTGFFLVDEKHQYFLVTARHVVDPKYLPPSKKRHAICSKMRIAFQAAVNAGTSNASIAYQTLEVSEPDFHFEASEVDLAVLKIPIDVLPICRDTNIVRPCAFPVDFLASAEELATRHAGEPIIFLGFPDNAPVNRTESAEFHYPLLRQGVFAYPPVHGIDVQGELGRDYGLIDSFAQSGFSGGPVVSLQKGWADGSWHPKEDYRPSRVVGLICGHYRTTEDRSDGVHSGLSFFARSPSIRSLITKVRALGD